MQPPQSILNFVGDKFVLHCDTEDAVRTLRSASKEASGFYRIPLLLAHSEAELVQTGRVSWPIPILNVLMSNMTCGIQIRDLKSMTTGRPCTAGTSL